MKDLAKHQTLFAYNVAQLIMHIHKQGYSCSFGEAFRTKEQTEIYAKSGKGILNSLHCKRLAIDLNLFSPEGIYLKDTKNHEQFGIFWESLDKDNKWGGRFGDGNHYQMNFKMVNF